MIPKLLHFTWKSEQLPRQMQDYYDAWRRLHPDWDVRLWTDDGMRAFVADAYPDFLPVYDGYPKMIQRADAFRYLVLGHLGGVYADLDVEPLQPISPLMGYDCFLGIEPLEHIFPDRHHQGVPFLLTNAFMGSVPGHRLWTEIIALMPELVAQETFYSTGPSMVTAAVLRLGRRDRPTLLAPDVWSPLLSDGRRTRRNSEAMTLLKEVGAVSPDSETLVSHKWMTTWVPWHKRGNRYAGIVQWPTAAKWALRRLRHRKLAQVHIADPAELYIDQNFVVSPGRPHVQVALRVDDRPLDAQLVAALAALDYPHDRLTVSVHLSMGRDGLDEAERLRSVGMDVAIVTEEAATPAARDNAILDGLASGAEYVLLIDGSVRAFPSDALQTMLGTRRPVVAGNAMSDKGLPADPALFRYDNGASFRVLYKDGGRTGQVRGNPAFRTTLEAQRAFRLLPVDGVGQSFVLIARPVIEAGVRFAEAPYKLHVGAEGFGIMARDRGFEACGLPGLRVVVAR